MLHSPTATGLSRLTYETQLIPRTSPISMARDATLALFDLAAGAAACQSLKQQHRISTITLHDEAASDWDREYHS